MGSEIRCPSLMCGLDPLSPVINADEGVFFYSLGRDQEAKVRLRRAIELAPDFGQPHDTLALIDLEEGNSSNALKEARAGLALDATNPRTIGEPGYVFAETGHADEAKRLLSILNDMVHRGSATPTYAALIQVGLGERTAALASLEHAANTIGIEGLLQWRPFTRLSSEPRYQKLLNEMSEMKSSNLSSPKNDEN